MPLPGAVTVTVKIEPDPLARLAIAGHVTTPELAVPPPLALTKVTVEGNASETTTLLAADGPRLVTVTV